MKSQEQTLAEARAVWTDIQNTRARSREFIGYWRGGATVQLWGIVWFVCYLASSLSAPDSQTIWLIGVILGVSGSIVLGRHGPQTERAESRKFLFALAILILFGVVVSGLINNGIGIALFWNCLSMTGYMLIGIWQGKRWFWLGATVFVASVVTYYALPLSWFSPIMALLGGGGLFLGGTWMRRAA